MTFRFTFLGTGSSAGVPRIGNHWGNADRRNPKNRRRRCAALIERYGPRGKTVVLIDTPPDIREQCLDNEILAVDAVIYTHDHADHTHGIDDLRAFFINTHKRVSVYMDAPTTESLVSRFRYCFEGKAGSSYPAILDRHLIAPGEPVTIVGNGGPVTLLPILQEHGEFASLGFRVGRLCYSPDIVGIPEVSRRAFDNLDIWIVDALRPLPHPAHWSQKQALRAIAEYAPARAYLTHMHIDMDYETLCRELPEHVRPAYDGLAFEFEC